MSVARAYYNENDKGAAAWLRELIKEGLIADGVVDERSIKDVHPFDLKGFTQVHMFAGIGGWSHALRLAGWPDDLPVWTGSCPCQPFSQAGKKLAQKDERDLWPEFHRLIKIFRPPTIFGEQVASPLGRQWLNRVRTDLEALGYAVGAADLCAASVGSPHIRQRLFWVAHADRPKRRRRNKQTNRHAELFHAPNGRSHGGLADAGPLPTQFITNDGAAPIAKQGSDETTIESSGCRGAGGLEHAASDGRQQRWPEPSGGSIVSGCGDGGLGDALIAGPQGHAGHGDDGDEPGRLDSQPTGSTSPSGDACGMEHTTLPTGTRLGQQPEHIPGTAAWNWGGGCTIIQCSDGKARRIPVEPSLFPLAHGLPGRVGLLRGAGNAIVPQVAATFIRAYMEWALENGIDWGG